MTQEQYYLNKLLESCIPLPTKDPKYLLEKNHLSEFLLEEEKAEARSNLRITFLLEQLKALIDAKVISADAIAWDLVPTEGNIDHVLSSDAINRLFYTKENIDSKIAELYRLFVQETKITIDEELSDESTNPVQNKAIKYVLDGLYENILELTNAISELGNEFDESLREQLANKVNLEDLTNYVTKLKFELDILNLINTINQTNLSNLTIHKLTTQEINDPTIEDAWELLDSNGNKIGDRISIKKHTSSSELEETVNELLELINNLQKFIVITESAYEALTEYVEDAVYLVIENDSSEPSSEWKLGDGLPIILS